MAMGANAHTPLWLFAKQTDHQEDINEDNLRHSL